MKLPNLLVSKLQLKLVIYFLCCFSLFAIYFFAPIGSEANTTDHDAQLLQKTPQRLIVLNPTLTEILFALGLGNKIVGVSDYSDIPEEAKKIPRIGGYSSPSIEKIIALKPDLVLLSPEGVDNITESLKKAGIVWRELPLRQLEDFRSTLQVLAKDFNISEKTNSLLRTWESDWQRVSQLQLHTKAIIQVDSDPVVLVGGDSFLTQALSKCGVQNSFSELRGYPRINLEALSQKHFDTVIVTVANNTPQVRSQILKFWKELKTPQKRKVIFVDPNDLSRLGPRLAHATLDLCQKLQAL